MAVVKETNDRGVQPGIYYHPGAKKFAETTSVVGKANYGVVQAEAFIQLGYRPATEDEIKEYKSRHKEKE